MKRLLSIVLSVFLILSANSVALAYEYDFSTDLEKFTESVSELIAAGESGLLDSGSNALSGEAGIYYSDANNVGSEQETNTDFTNRLIVKSSEKLDTLNAVSCVSGYNDLYILQFASSEDFLSAYDYYLGLDSVEYLQEDMYCSVQTEEESTTDSVEETTEETTEPITEEPSDNNGNESVFNPTQTQSDIFGFTALKTHLAEAGVTYSDIIEVAVLDSGVANNHPIFEGRIEPTGFNSIDSEDDCFDDFGHGTHVAGIIAANTPDNVIIKPYKVLNNEGVGTDLQVYLGIEQAIADGVEVINMSLSRRGYSTVLYEAITHAEEQGVIVVASAGNKRVNLNDITYSPAEFPEVVTVASCTDDFQLSEFSNYGGQTDIAAPGNSINSASLDGGYTVKSGTSMSAGFISAAVSYLILQFPEYSRSDIELALYNNGKPCITTTTSVNYIYAEYLTKEKEPSTTPIFSYTKSLFTDPFELKITCEDETAEIYYRTSMMQEGEFYLYSEPIPINHDLAVFAFTISKGSNRSSSVGYSYTRRPPTDTSEFTVDSNGVLTDYTGVEQHIVVPLIVSGVRVKSVAEDVFKGNTEIKSVSFPVHTTSIPDNAFKGCTNLEFVRIKNVTSVGDNAFSGCSALKCVASDSLTSVGDFAFYNCSNLSSFIFTILSDIGESAFENTSSLEIVGINSFTNISKRAFCNSAVTEISLNNALTIGEEAFFGCENLKYISGERITDIGQSAFTGCKNIISVELNSLINLSNDTFSGIDTIEAFSANSLKTLPDDVFKDYKALTDISFSNVEFIGSNAFLNTKIKSAIFNNLTSMGENVFSGCSDLTEISFNNLDSIDFGMFFDAPGIKSISLENATAIYYDIENEFLGLKNYFPNLESFSMPMLEEIPENMFKNCAVLSGLTFTNLKKVGKYAFYNSNVSSVGFADASQIYEYAFYNCDALTEILLPQATFVGTFAFAECDNITSFEANLVESFDFDILHNSGALLKTLSLDSVYTITKSGSVDFTYSEFPELVTFTANRLRALQDSAFENCKNLRNVNIISAKTIGNKAFKNSGVAKINVSGATSIGEECFRGCLRLTNIDLASAESIGDLAFYGCSNITDFSAGSIDEFDLNTLYGCVKLKSLSIDGAESIKGLDFSELNTLENLWPLLSSFSANSLQKVPQYMFYQFKNIENISLNSIKNIPNNTFKGSGLISAVFPVAASVSDYAFAGCKALETVELDNATSIGKDILNGCSAVKSLSLNSLKEIPTFDDFTYTFRNNNNLQTVSMDSLVSIPGYFFYYCYNLKNASFNAATNIGECCFAGTDISKTSFDSLKTINSKAFYGCDKLTSFNFSQLESIGNSAFQNSGLFKVVMDSPTELGQAVFSACFDLEEVDFKNMPNLNAISLFGSETLGSASYNYVKRFSWGGINEVPASFFVNCKYLEEVVLYDAEIVGENAFQNCTALTSVEAPNLKVVKDYAFYNCKKLAVGSSDIAAFAEELGAYSITNTKSTGNGSLHTVVFDKLKIAHENSFSDVEFAYAKFPALEIIHDLPEARDYVLIGSVVEEIHHCADITSTVYAVPGTPVLEYSDEYNLGWLPFNSETGLISDIPKASLTDTPYFSFEAMGFDLKYEWYSASKADLSDAQLLCTGSYYDFSLEENADPFVYCVATSSENGNIVKIRSRIAVVPLNTFKRDGNTYTNMNYVFTEKTECIGEFDAVTVHDGISYAVEPSYSSGGLSCFGTGTELDFNYNDEREWSFTLVMLGDVTCDGVVDVLDAARFNNVFLDCGYDQYDVGCVAADANGDKDIDANDYQLLVNKILAK